MDYRGVIFDFNGTLFFDNDKHVKAWGAISQLLRNKGITDEELHEHFNGVPNKQIIQYMLGDKCTEDDIVKYSSLKEEYYRKCNCNKNCFYKNWKLKIIMKLLMKECRKFRKSKMQL